MKKLNLLSKTEMKKVLGGVLSMVGCTNDSQCPSGQWCCTDMSKPTEIGPKMCQVPDQEPWPDLPGSPGGMQSVCPGGGW